LAVARSVYDDYDYDYDNDYDNDCTDDRDGFVGGGVAFRDGG
jgi:hypothetical protein